MYMYQHDASSNVYLLGLPLRQPALVQVIDAMRVGLDSFFFEVPNKGVAQLWGDNVGHKVGIEEDPL